MKNFAHENKTEHRETASAGLPIHNGTADPISFYNNARSTQCDATKDLPTPFGIFSVFYNEEFLTHELMTEGKFDKLLCKTIQA